MSDHNEADKETLPSEAEKFRSLNNGCSDEYSHQVTPRCPHCGTSIDIEQHEAWFIYNDDESHDLTCLSCGGSFTVKSHATWRFSTDEQDDFS